MLLNKDIFLTFLNSTDWTHENTYNLYVRTFKEYDEKVDKAEEDAIYFKEKYDEMLKKCEDLKKKIIEKVNISTQTYIHNINCAAIDYNICEKPQEIKPKTISNLNLDIMWDEAKEIMSDDRKYKDKNKDMIVLLCDYKKDLIRLMGKSWYKKCVRCVEEYGKIDEEKQSELYKKMVLLFQEIFDNEW